MVISNISDPHGSIEKTNVLKDFRENRENRKRVHCTLYCTEHKTFSGQIFLSFISRKLLTVKKMLLTQFI